MGQERVSGHRAPCESSYLGWSWASRSAPAVCVTASLLLLPGISSEHHRPDRLPLCWGFCVQPLKGNCSPKCWCQLAVALCVSLLRQCLQILAGCTDAVGGRAGGGVVGPDLSRTLEVSFCRSEGCSEHCGEDQEGLLCRWDPLDLTSTLGFNASIILL